MADERQGPGLPGQDIFGLPETGNPVADILMRITPEDGAVDGRLRDDWPSICLKAAEHAEARKAEIREEVTRSYPDSPWQHEYFARAMMQAALRYRDRLLDRTDG